MADINQILTISDFTGRYKLAVSSQEENNFNQFLKDVQYDLLIDLFGAELYNDYAANSADTNWTNLLNGVDDYTGLDGYKYNWRGLKYLMKPLVVALYPKFNEYRSVQGGTARSQFQNATAASEFAIQSRHYKFWNEFIDRYNECYQYMITQYSNDSDKYTDFWVHFVPKHKDSIISKSSIA